MNIRKSIYFGLILFSATQVQAAKLSLDQFVHLSFINGVAANELANSSRKSAELSPGTYQIVVKYGNADTFKKNARPFHSKPNILVIEVDERDMKLALPIGYRNVATARYNFDRTPEWSIEYSDGSRKSLKVEQVSGTVMEYDAKIMAAYEQFKASNE
ncbi:DUF2057 family protein [Alginatibacterium sediminis]|nr:DUF2057 family protein [Alginatibacterium sediminis]